MCGIVGYIGTQAATGILLEGLRKLEYRGYDSAGVATVGEGALSCVRAKGKLFNLEEKLESLDNPARIGIGHTRWATHGKPEEHNAHPHLDGGDRVAVVQNGIIENYRELRDELKDQGFTFKSETDTEVVPQLIARELKVLEEAGGLPAGDPMPSVLMAAVRRAIALLEGAFALAVICRDFPDELVVVRQQAPLSIGFGQGEFFCASDTPALIPHTRAVLTLDNQELARLTPLGAEIYSFEGDRLTKYPHTLDWNPVLVEKQGFRHYMLKEIYEQPGVVRDCLEAYTAGDRSDVPVTPEHPASEINQFQAREGVRSPFNLNTPTELYGDLRQIHVLACGTSWHAGLVGKYLLEQIAQVPTTVHYASEYRYAPTPLTPHTLTIGVTQSGETSDTLSALESERDRRANHPDPAYRAHLIGITNRPENTISRVADYIIPTHAGIEIGVAATKTFIAQLMAFYALAIDIACYRGSVTGDRAEELLKGLRELPAQIETIVAQQDGAIEHLAHDFTDTQDFIFIGRGINFPIALEGALKLKEISYIHAEGYPAGEMKHGPIALLDSRVPVVSVAVPGSVYEKTISNTQEAKARDAKLIGVVVEGDTAAAELFDTVLTVPAVDEILSPLLTAIPLQLLAYHIASRRGLDVDQPRNLAKSVTVE